MSVFRRAFEFELPAHGRGDELHWLYEVPGNFGLILASPLGVNVFSFGNYELCGPTTPIGQNLAISEAVECG
jgi:hypothetical protein